MRDAYFENSLLVYNDERLMSRVAYYFNFAAGEGGPDFTVFLYYQES